MPERPPGPYRARLNRVLAVLPRQVNVPWPTAKRWASRYAQMGESGMADRSSRPHHTPAALAAGAASPEWDRHRCLSTRTGQQSPRLPRSNERCRSYGAGGATSRHLSCRPGAPGETVGGNRRGGDLVEGLQPQVEARGPAACEWVDSNHPGGLNASLVFHPRRNGKIGAETHGIGVVPRCRLRQAEAT
jgi:hypothetical protein